MPVCLRTPLCPPDLLWAPCRWVSPASTEKTTQWKGNTSFPDTETKGYFGHDYCTHAISLFRVYSDALVDLVRFYSFLLKVHAAGLATPALPHTSGNLLHKQNRGQSSGRRFQVHQPQNPHARHVLDLAFNKCIGDWHAADVLLAWDGYQDIFRKLGTLSCRKTDRFRG